MNDVDWKKEEEKKVEMKKNVVNKRGLLHFPSLQCVFDDDDEEMKEEKEDERERILSKG